MPIVLDNSIVMSWSLADEADPVAERAMQRVVGEGAVVPGIWWYELRNAFVVNERRGRLDAADTGAILTDLSELRITLDSDHDDGALLALARQHGLSIYDAAYLEVALRRELPLATLDQQLRQAAATRAVTLVG